MSDVRDATDTDLAVLVDHLDVTYEILEDSQRKLRRLFARDEGHHRRRSVRAVKDVSFATRTGEAIGIIGHNGSGKSTLLRALSGLLPPTNGRVFARSVPVLLGVGAALDKDLSGRRNVLLGGTALGLSRAEVEERMDEIIEFAGLEEYANMPIRAYSSGMKARLQFAIATATTPDILIIDEALSVGDEEFRERSQARLHELIDGAGTVFVVSHTLGSVRDLATRVLWMDHGNLVADGDPDEVIDAYRDYVKARRRARRKAS